MNTNNNSIKIVVHSDGPIINKDSTESIIKNINNMRESVEALREENINLERIRDQYMIHLQQCQEDHGRLRQIYKKLKLKYDLGTRNYPEIISQNQQPPNLLSMQMQPTPLPLQFIHIIPQIQSLSKNFPASNIKLRKAINIGSIICSIQFTYDGTKFAFADGCFAYILDSETIEIISTIQLPPLKDPNNRSKRVLSFSPNGKLLALSGSDCTMLLYDVETKRLLNTFSGHTKDIHSILFSSNGEWVITGGYDSVINIWNTQNFEQIKHIIHNSESEQNEEAIVKIDAPPPESAFYAVGFLNGKVTLYNETFERTNIFSAHEDSNLLNIAVSPLDDTVATVGGDNAIKIWFVRGVASLKHTLKGHQDFPVAVSFSSKERLIFTGSKDHTIRIWEYKTGESLCLINAHHETVFSIAHHPKKRSFISSDGEGIICIWDYNYTPE